MALKTKKEYYRKVMEKKDILIDELVEEFGEDKRTLLEENFAKIKWVFFIGIPNLQREINKTYSKKSATITLEFLKDFIGLSDIYIKDSLYDFTGYIISSKNREELNSVYGKNVITFDITNNVIKDEITGIWSFNPNIDKEKVKRYGEYRNKNFSEMLNSLRCDFLRFLKKYPEEYSDEQIIQDPKFQHYCEHYSSGIQQYIERMEANKECVSEELELYNRIIKTRSNIYIEAFRSMLKGPLYSYLSSNDKNVIDANANFSLEDISIMHQIFYYNQSLNQESKIEKASDEYLKNFINSPDNQFTEDVDVRKIIKEAREQANEEAIKKYNSLVIFDGNVDFSKEHVCLDLSQLEGQMMSIFINEGDLEEGRFIVFDPYASPDANYDVHLRHELRHSLTSSISINKDGIVIVKVGNNLFYYLEDNLIGSENTDFNEYFTQKKALENTRVAYQKGIYVLTSPGTKQPLSPTSSYDEYLPEFDKIYNLLSKEARKSQIELTNENLYREISAISIKDLESKIFYREVLDVEILKELIGKEKNGYPHL